MRLVRGHADRDRHVVEVRRPDHLLALRLGDRPVLRVEEDLVGTAPRQHLDEPRSVKLEAGGEHGPAGPELVLDPLAAHDESPWNEGTTGHPRTSLAHGTPSDAGR